MASSDDTNIHSLVVSALMAAAPDWPDISRQLGIYKHVSSHVAPHSAPIHGLDCLVAKIITDRMTFAHLEQTLRDMELIRDAVELESLRRTRSPAVPASAIIADWPYSCASRTVSPVSVAPAPSVLTAPVRATVAPVQDCAAVAPGAESPPPSPAPAAAALPTVATVAPSAARSVHSGPVRVRARTPPSGPIPGDAATHRRACVLLAAENCWRDVCIALGINPVEVECQVCTGSPSREYARHFFEMLHMRCISLARLAAAYESVTGDANAMYAACGKM